MGAASTEVAAVVLALAVSASAYAQVPSEVIGVYSRSTPTCGFGGPGGADRSSSSCSGGEVFEDRLEVSTSSAAEANVSFALHFNLAQNLFCTYNGVGSWAGRKLNLGPSEQQLQPQRADPQCQLSVSFANGSARVSDLGDRCSFSLCNGPAKLNGLTYRKTTQ
jgi:hypothetical protein